VRYVCTYVQNFNRLRICVFGSKSAYMYCSAYAYTVVRRTCISFLIKGIIPRGKIVHKSIIFPRGKIVHKSIIFPRGSRNYYVKKNCTQMDTLMYASSGKYSFESFESRLVTLNKLTGTNNVQNIHFKLFKLD
jgi:hypothetical protein